METISYNPSDILIFGGDMNKSLSELGVLIGPFELDTNKQDESIQTFIQAAHITSAPDHILSKNLPGKVDVITSNDGNKILYDTAMINEDLIMCLIKYKDFIESCFKEKKSIFEINKEIADELIGNLCTILSSSNNYISDHNPIILIT
jgi:hypothetical protein